MIKKKKTHFEGKKSTKKHFSITKKHYHEKSTKKTLLFLKTLARRTVNLKICFCTYIINKETYEQFIRALGLFIDKNHVLM